MSVIHTDKIDGFLGDLDVEQALTLVNLVAGLDSTEMVRDSSEEGFRPRYSADEMSLIGAFQDFLVDNVEEDEDDSSDPDEEEDEEVPTTGFEPVASNAEPTA